MKYRIQLLGLILMILLSCSACRSVNSGQNQETDASDQITIGVSFPTTRLAFRSKMLELLKAYAGTCGERVEFMITDADSSQEQQNQDLLQMIDDGVDGIILIPYTMEGELSIIEYGLQQGIPIMTLDNSITSSYQKRTIGYVGADHQLMGQQAGELLIHSLEKRYGDQDQLKVLYLTGVSNSSGAVDRDKGIRSVIENDERVQVVAEYNGEFTFEKAESIMSDCLIVYPDLQGVICQNDLMADGVCSALEKADKIGEIVVIGIDGQRSVVERIASGQMEGTVFQDPAMILDAVKRMEEYLKGTSYLAFNMFEETTPIDDGNAAEYLEKDLPW